MSNLLKYSTPAERMGGLSFSEIGGTFTGSDNIFYKLNGNEFNSNEITLQTEFYPEFNWDINDFIYIYDTPNGQRYRLLKLTNSSGNVLNVMLGNSTIASIPSVNYSPYWLVNKRNIITITSDTIDTDINLNDNIVYSSSTAWVKKNPSLLSLGSNYLGSAGYFIGNITSFKFFKRILTHQEISDKWNNSTYNYKNKYLIHYPMTQGTHTGSQTLDISGNGLHGTLIGSPTKLTGQGYSFSGSGQNIGFTEQTFTDEFTLAMFNKPNETTLEGLFGHTTDTNKIILQSGSVFVRVITTSDVTTVAPGTVINFLGLTRDSNNKVDLYINHNKYRLFGDVAQAGDTLWDYIGRTESGTQYLNGNIYETIIDNKCLTPTQMHDLSLKRIGV